MLIVVTRDAGRRCLGCVKRNDETDGREEPLRDGASESIRSAALCWNEISGGRGMPEFAVTVLSELYTA